MARPIKTTKTVYVDITLSLTTGEDDDLITWFASLPARGRATAVIARLRTGQGETLHTSQADASPVIHALANMMF